LVKIQESHKDPGAAKQGAITTQRACWRLVQVLLLVATSAGPLQPYSARI
jgi:hypothetical protein